MPEIETINDCCVAANNGDIVFLVPVERNMERAKALRMAAWIVALADRDGEFASVLAAVQST